MTSVREQYEKWIYPLPSNDLSEDRQEGYFEFADPSLFRRKLWPRPIEPARLKVLVAGCGTMQAARLAFRNPDCEVVGIDISESSLAHERFLKQKHDLVNLRLHCLAIDDVETLGEQFDLIISTGVLHHLPDPDSGLRKLKAVLLPHGVMSIMVYGWYRRFGVYMMQQAFRLLGVEQSKAGVALVRETLGAMPAWHHVQSFVRSANDMNYDAGVVDLFLHVQDRAYSVPQVLRLAGDNGLRFQDWLDRHDYSLSAHIDSALSLYGRAAMLAAEDQWELVELLGQLHDCHNFLLCHQERNDCVDFSPNDVNAAWRSYVPQHRWPTDVRESQGKWLTFAPQLQALAIQEKGPVTFRRYKHEFVLGGPELAMFAHVDGKATIAEIVEKCWTQGSRPADSMVLAFFTRMHDWDHLLFQI